MAPDALCHVIRGTTMTAAFQRMKRLIRFSRKSSPGNDACSSVGIVLT